MIRLVCVVGGGDLAIIPHLIDHYRELGVESFQLVRHAESEGSPEYELAERYARQAGIDLFHTHLGPWDQTLNERLTEYAMSLNPDDWFVVVDQDEFHVYDRALPDLIAMCEAEGYDYVSGCLVDRVAADGEFPTINTSNLWRQFPLAGAVGAHLSRALPLKVGLARDRVRLLSGHHGAADGRGLPHDRSYIQVHHFKWTDSVMERLRTRAHKFESGEWKAEYSEVAKEARMVLSYIESHGGRIDIHDRSLRLQPCGASYGDHPHWKELAEEAGGWSWAITY